MRTLSLMRTALVGGLSVGLLATTAAAQDQIAVLPTQGSLVALPAGADDLLFSGEIGRQTLVMVAEPEQLVGNSSLFLTMQTAVSVAPEWSQVTVAVNDQELGVARLMSGEPYSMEFPVPAGLLQPGYNAVSFVVNQAHRVDCSLDATYELWTRIDPTQSGFAFQGASAAGADFSTILAAARTADGATVLRGIAGAIEGQRSQRLLAAFQTLAIGALIDRPAVEFGAGDGTGPGIDVVTGSREDIARLVTNLPMSLVDGLNIGKRPDGRVVVAIVARTDEDFAQALRMLRDGLNAAHTGSQAGLAALRTLQGPALPPSGQLSFAALDVDTRDFGGRLYDQSVSFRLPADFYPADYAQAQINLDALYAPGLAPGAALQFKVNDQVVSTLKLSGSRVGEAQNRRLPIPLSAFRPGLNRLEIAAMLPAYGDASCAPGSTAFNGRRLQLAGSSTLELPTLGRVGRFPDLAALDLSLIGGDRSQTLNVVVPSGQPAEMGAAASLLARLAFSSGRVLDATISTAPTVNAEVPVLMIGAIDDLPGNISSKLPIDLKAGPQAVPTGTSADAQFVASSGPLPHLPTVEELASDAAGIYDGLRASLYGLGLSFGTRIDALRVDETRVPPVAGTDLVVAQTMNAFDTAPVTVITAPDRALLAEAMPQVIAPTGWSRLDGSAVALASTGERLQTVDSHAVFYYPTGDSSLGNARLVVAGWLSNTPSVYVLLLLTAALVLGTCTQLLLVATRRRRRSKR